jgi:succinate dehydrogenase/fumarate reductase flavoprotein subunit
MAMEVRQGRGPIYLDMTHFTPKDIGYIRDVLPVATKAMERAGILVGDRITRKLPWIPNGPGTESHGAGIRIDMECKTSIEGFFAAGGTANNDYSGMGWAIVTGVRAGQFAAGYIRDVPLVHAERDIIESGLRFTLGPLERKQGISHDHLLLSLQETIMPYEVYLIRHKDRLSKALEEIERIKATQLPYLHAYDPHHLRMAHEAQNLLLFAEMLLRSALVREESRLGHLREDFPETDNINWMKWTVVRKENDRMVIGTRDMPLEDFPIKPEKKKFKHPVFAAADRLGGKVEG